MWIPTWPLSIPLPFSGHRTAALKTQTIPGVLQYGLRKFGNFLFRRVSRRKPDVSLTATSGLRRHARQESYLLLFA